MNKVLLIIIGVLILLAVILILIIKFKSDKIKTKEKKIDELIVEKNEREIKMNILNEELKIEKEFNEKIKTKLANISDMSIDDILHELQNG